MGAMRHLMSAWRKIAGSFGVMVGALLLAAFAVPSAAAAEAGFSGMQVQGMKPKSPPPSV